VGIVGSKGPPGSRSVGSCQWLGVVGCHNCLLLWPCGHSRLYVVVAAGVSL